MLAHREKCREPNNYREPVEDADLPANQEVGPERQEEIIATVERNTADDVPDCGAQEARQSRTGPGENDVPSGRPDGTVEVIAKLERDAAQHQEPQHDH